jgi:hypothetical protein
MVRDLENSLGQTVSVSDGLGNTYRQAGPYVRLNNSTDPGLSGEIVLSIWYAITVASGTRTPTATGSGAGATTIVHNLSEFTNADPVSPFGNASAGVLGSEIDSGPATLSAGNLTVDGARARLFQLPGQFRRAVAPWTAGSGFTLLASSPARERGEYQTTPPQGTMNPAITIGSAFITFPIGLGVVFKPASS